jgi:hypothetical protein
MSTAGHKLWKMVGKKGVYEHKILFYWAISPALCSTQLTQLTLRVAYVKRVQNRQSTQNLRVKHPDARSAACTSSSTPDFLSLVVRSFDFNNWNDKCVSSFLDLILYLQKCANCIMTCRLCVSSCCFNLFPLRFVLAASRRHHCNSSTVAEQAFLFVFIKNKV